MTNPDLDRLEIIIGNIVRTRLKAVEQHRNGIDDTLTQNQLITLEAERNTLITKLSSQLNDVENYKNFNEGVTPHKFLREGKEDYCQSCGFPERFHQFKLANADKNEQITTFFKELLKHWREHNLDETKYNACQQCSLVYLLNILMPANLRLIIYNPFSEANP